MTEAATIHNDDAVKLCAFCGCPSHLPSQNLFCNMHPPIRHIVLQVEADDETASDIDFWKGAVLAVGLSVPFWMIVGYLVFHI